MTAVGAARPPLQPWEVVNLDDVDARLAGIAALGDPVRRALYRYVVAQADPVSREQAAGGVGVSRHVAKFHLDKLHQNGLLEVEFRRPPGRGGPGGGRPPKLYRRSTRELAVSLPERRYELAGRIMATAITDAQRDSLPIAAAVRRAARDAGRALGREARQRAGARPSRSALLDAVGDVLGRCGYEPRREVGGITLANCPFHDLAGGHSNLVCAINLDLMDGLLDELELRHLRAQLDPAPWRCCVRLCHQ